MKVLYYYYFLFYKKSPLDLEPEFTAKLALTASESLLVISVLDIFTTYFFCWSLNKYYMAGITLIILAINSFFILTSKETAKVEKSKPQFFKSHKLSILLTWSFFLATTSSMFWLGDVVQKILNSCRK